MVCDLPPPTHLRLALERLAVRLQQQHARHPIKEHAAVLMDPEAGHVKRCILLKRHLVEHTEPELLRNSAQDLTRDQRIACMCGADNQQDAAAPLAPNKGLGKGLHSLRGVRLRQGVCGARCILFGLSVQPHLRLVLVVQDIQGLSPTGVVATAELC